MKLKFIKSNQLGDQSGFYIFEIYEDGKDTEKITYELLGFIFKDEDSYSWNINDEYSGIVSFDEIEQIYKFMKQLRVPDEDSTGQHNSDGERT